VKCLSGAITEKVKSDRNELPGYGLIGHVENSLALRCFFQNHKIEMLFGRGKWEPLFERRFRRLFLRWYRARLILPPFIFGTANQDS
jgi:hypothetical protein